MTHAVSASSPPSPDVPIDTRLKISALWIAMLFIFAYVDIFSLFKPGMLDDIQSGTIYKFDITQTFLFLTTLFIVIPSLMVFFTLVMPRRINRMTNIVLAAVYAVICVGNSIGEWNYYIFASILEGLLLVGVIYYARTLTDTPQPTEHSLAG